MLKEVEEQQKKLIEDKKKKEALRKELDELESDYIKLQQVFAADGIAVEDIYRSRNFKKLLDNLDLKKNLEVEIYQRDSHIKKLRERIKELDKTRELYLKASVQRSISLEPELEYQEENEEDLKATSVRVVKHDIRAKKSEIEKKKILATKIAAHNSDIKVAFCLYRPL